MELKFVFFAEWYNAQAEIAQQFKLSFYPKDNSVEVFNMQTNKMFLKRTVIKELNFQSIIIGNTISILKRDYLLIEYADNETKKQLSKNQDKIFVIFKFLDFESFVYLISLLEKQEIYLNKMALKSLNENQIQKIQNLINDNLNQPIQQDIFIGIELVQSSLAQKIERAYQELLLKNNCYQQLDFFEIFKNNYLEQQNLSQQLSQLFFHQFSQEKIDLNCLQNTTCLIIKPHILKSKQLHLILEELSQILTHSKSKILNLKIFKIERTEAQELLEVYQDVDNKFSENIEELISGNSLAICIQGPFNIIQIIKELCGPFDINMAKQLRQYSLWAWFGFTQAQNAVHCSDIEENAAYENNFIFNILQ